MAVMARTRLVLIMAVDMGYGDAGCTGDFFDPDAAGRRADTWECTSQHPEPRRRKDRGDQGEAPNSSRFSRSLTMPSRTLSTSVLCRSRSLVRATTSVA